MDEKGIADPAGFILTLLSLPLIFVGVVAVLRSVQRESGRRRLADLATSKVPTDFGQTKALREALANGAVPDRLPELWLYASALRSRRWMLLLQTGVLMGSWGGFLERPSVWQICVAGLVTAICLPLLVFTERNARVADAFLRRYPEGSPMRDEVTGDRGPVA